MENTPIDFEVSIKVGKARRFFLFFIEGILISIVCLFSFAFISLNILKSIPDYQVKEAERIQYRNELNEIGKESKLANFYFDGNPIDEHGMYIRYCYKHINLMFKFCLLGIEL